MPPVNFREVAHLASRHGGTVVPGRIFRSAQIVPAGEADLAEILAYDFGLVVDLRYPSERRAAVAPWPATHGSRVLFHGRDEAGESPQDVIKRLKPRTVPEADRYYEDLYAELPFDATYRSLFAEALCRIAELDRPVLVHCTQGKDRTGMLIGMLLDILGADRNAIMADFMLTGTANMPGGDVDALLDAIAAEYGYRMPIEVLSRMMSVQDHYLPVTFRAIEARCGSTDAYFDEMGVGEAVRRKLRGALLAS